LGIAHLRGLARSAAGALAIAALLVCAGPAAASGLTDSLSLIENMRSDTPTSQLVGPPAVTAKRFEPSLASLPSLGLGSTASPEDDLAAALEALAATRPDDTSGAEEAVRRALGILDGAGAPAVPDDRAYQGMPLLNWNMAQRVKRVPAEGNVDVREVRFGDHAMLDTWLLDFEDPTKPFTITWHISEVGSSFGGQLAPATLLLDGRTQIGQHSLLTGLAQPNLFTGTSAKSRFHPAGAGEETRLTTQTLKVKMPPARFVKAILDPNLKPGHETFAQILPAGDGRLAGAQATFGDTKAGAIAKLAEQAPESQIHRELGLLLGPEGQLTGSVADAAAKATELRPLVGAMRSRDSLPAGVSGVPGADVDVVLMNNEAYVSRRSVRLAPGAELNVGVTNLDGFARTFEAVDLKGRERTLGADDWGAFWWSDLGAPVPVAAGASETIRLRPSDEAFSLWLGDADMGDQAGMTIDLDRGPVTQSLEVGGAGSLPLHQALDGDGRVWVTMEGSDELVRLNPTDGAISDGAPTRFPLPGGLRDPANPPPAGQTDALLGPADVAIDGRGMVWTTLVAGNAIARLDPSRARPGTTAGIDVFKLDPCNNLCRKPLPPVVPGPLSRQPLQLEVFEDGGGNTVAWFTEMAADRIGVIRVSPEGRKVNETHFGCGKGCLMPLGIALDDEGRVYFSEGISNRIGRLTLDTARPYTESAIAAIDHFEIPSSVEEFTPGAAPCAGPPACPLPNPAKTSLPHSVQIDPHGRVWFTEEATEKVGYLDPAKAEPNTTEGMVEADGPTNDFKRSLAPADIAFDRAGKAFVSDEYGDQIATATVAPDGKIEMRTAFRPTARNSFTDAPMLDDKGNLWFIESGAETVTRVSDVSAGAPRPARSPLLVADTSTGTLSAEGLREMDAVDLVVLRDGREVDRAADIRLSGGGFETALAMRAGDRVQVTPKGHHAPRPFAFRVADLRATVGADGSVSGLARVGAEALADDVTITAGAMSATARIGSVDGAFSWGGGLDQATGGGTLSWTGGTVAARFRTVASFGRNGGDSAPPAATPSAGGSGAGAAPAAPVTPGPAQRTPGAGTKAAICSPTRWLTRTGSGAATRRALPLLSLDGAGVRRCLGRPARRARSGRDERWSYPGVLELRLTGGRVTAFTLLGARMRSAPDRAAVGGGLPAFRRALGTLARDARGDLRGLVALGSAGYGDVRVTQGRAGRVTRVTVALRSARALDATARRLLRSAR
jgi:streptogramin lyase